MILESTQVLTFTNLKGGVGKTTSTANVGSALAKLGYKVLLVDWDQQGNLTKFFGIDKVDNLKTLFQALIHEPESEEFYDPEKLSPYEVPLYKGNLYLLAADFELSKFDALFGQPGLQGSEYVLASALSPFLDDFDFILIDTAPSLSRLTLNAYYASDFLIIPLEPGGFSSEGLNKILNIKSKAKKHAKIDLKIAGVFFSRTKPNTVLTKDFFRDFKEREDVDTLDTVIRDYVPLAESAELNMDIFSYDAYMNEDEEQYKQTNGVEDYYNLTNEILYKIGLTKSFNRSRIEEASEKKETDVVKKNLSKKKGSLKADFENFLKQNV
ncbi:MAG: ParA family protein [Balneola sp.]